jgi:hypothetical protein
VTPFVSWGTTDGLWVHRGTDPNVPSANVQTASGFNCCGYDPAVVSDGATGAMVVAWYAIVNQGNAVYARTLDPATGAPTATTLRMPGTLGAVTANQRVGLVAIPGQAGSYIAYAGGGVTSSQILVWKVGSATTPRVARVPGGARTPAIAATPDGRLWVAWSAKGRIWARRSNRAHTVWGATTSIPVKSHTDTVYKLALSAQKGVLDPAAPSRMQRRPLPGITRTRVPAGQRPSHWDRSSAHDDPRRRPPHRVCAGRRRRPRPPAVATTARALARGEGAAKWARQSTRW